MASLSSLYQWHHGDTTGVEGHCSFSNYIFPWCSPNLQLSQSFQVKHTRQFRFFTSAYWKVMNELLVVCETTKKQCNKLSNAGKVIRTRKKKEGRKRWNLGDRLRSLSRFKSKERKKKEKKTWKENACCWGRKGVKSICTSPVTSRLC